MDLEKLYEKQDKISEDITEIKIILARQELSLEHHIKRTRLAEENIEMLRQELKPVKKHVETVNTILKLFGAVSAVVSFSLGTFQLFKLIDR